MAGLLSEDYRRVLELTTAVLDSGETRLPWRLLADELRKAIPVEHTVLFWSQGWVDAAPQDFPLPYPRQTATSLQPAQDEALAFHPLLHPQRTAADRVPRFLDCLPDVGHWPDEQTHDLVCAELSRGPQLALPLPAPPGESHAILLARDGAAFSERERDLAGVLLPPLAAIVNQQRELLRRRDLDPALSETCAFENEHRLTARELAVLTLLGDTLTAAAIARRLGISPRTVHKHLESIYRKLGTRDRLATILRAQRAGLLPGR
jgi:DNA-binding NarL/FixJ family response regulator